VLYERSSGRIWLTDFDRVRLAPAAMDLGSYLAEAPSCQRHALLEGYAAHRPVPGDEELGWAIALSRLARLADPLRRAHPSWRERIGVQLQTAALPPKITVDEALALFASMYSDPADPSALLHELGIASKGRSYVDKLSGGQRQRVFIALALLGKPELVFLDELTTALDPQARLAMWDVVRSIRQGGATVVMTTHYMEEAEALCDRVAVIDHGRVIALDSIPALVAAHGGQAELRLTLSASAPRALADVEGVTSVRADGAVTVVCGTGAFAQAVLSHLAQAGVTVQNMETHSPGLEEVFLNLTGRAVRDA